MTAPEDTGPREPGPREPGPREPGPREPGAAPTSAPVPASASAPQDRYEPPPSVGKLLVWVVLFAAAALVVVLGGVYLT